MKLLLLLAWIWISAPGDPVAREANRAYEEGDYARAAQLYREALQRDPERAPLWYNLGNALAMGGDTEGAMDAFERAHDLFDDATDRANSRYNAAHALTQLEAWQEAEQQLRESLRQNPEDRDARHNYEIVKRRLEASREESSEEPDEGDGEGEQPDGAPDPGEPDTRDGAHPPGESGQQQGDSSPAPGEMSMEEAQSLLDALQQQEQELLENQNRASGQEETDHANW